MKRIITFERRDDAEAGSMAMFGMSNKHILRKIKNRLTTGQVTNRARRVKEELDMDEGLRVAWREGRSPLFKMVGKDILAIARKMIKEEVTPKIIHPTPETVDVKNAH